MIDGRPTPCDGVPHLFFTPYPEPDPPAPEFCATCPERLPCLIRGWDESHGTWGGLTTDERVEAKMDGLSPEEVLGQ